MNVFIYVWGSLGDVYPFIPLGQALRARGNTVTVLSTGNFEELFGGAGLGFHAIASAADYAAALRNPEIWNGANADDLIDKFADMLAGPAYRFIAERQGHGPVLVLAATRGIMMRKILAPLDVPVISAHLTPEIFRADASSSKIGLFPDWFAASAPDDPDTALMTGFPVHVSREDQRMSDAWQHLEQFLGAGEAPIVFTPGTAMSQGKFFFDAALQACERLARRAVFLSPYAEQIPTCLPPTVRHVDYLPLERLLPRAAALVYHGGIGSCAQALRSGTPQLVMPLAYDQFANARRVELFGVGDFLPPHEFTADLLAERLHDLTTSEAIRASCRRVMARFGDDDVMGKTCDLITAIQAAVPSPNKYPLSDARTPWPSTS